MTTMRRPLACLCCFALLCLPLLFGAGRARAAPEEGPAARNYRPAYEPGVKQGPEHPELFDLNKPEDQTKLVKALQAGEVDSLERDKPFDFFAMLKWDIGLWSVIVFLVLLFILGRYAWKPMLEGLQKREETIRGAIDDAQRSREEAQRLREQFQGEVNKAQEKVRDILEEGRRDAQRLTEEMLTKARGEIAGERERLRREVEMARDQALQELWNQAAQLATLISAKAIRRQLTPEDHRRLVDEALAELGPAGAARR
jgi:F-type H+-transporting ATPase subunit b